MSQMRMTERHEGVNMVKSDAPLSVSSEVCYQMLTGGIDF